MAEVRGGRPSGSEKATVKPKEFTLKNEAGLAEQGFSPYEIEGGRKLVQARKFLFEKPKNKADFKALESWLRNKRENPTARKFQHLLEQAAALKRISKPEIRQQAEAYMQKALSQRAESGPSGELLHALGQSLLGNEMEVTDPRVAKLLEALKQEEPVDGRTVSPVAAVTSPNITQSTRQEWWEKRVGPVVDFADWLNQQKSQENQPEDRPESEEKSQGEEGKHQPPQRSKDHKPSMDDKKVAKEKGEEKIADFTVTPGTKGFYEINSWQKWNGKNWASVATDTEYKKTVKKGGLSSTITGVAGGNETPIPLKENRVVSKDSLAGLKKQGFKITADSSGHVFITSPKGNEQFSAKTEEGDAVKYSSWYKDLVVKPDLTSAPVQVKVELDRIMAATNKTVDRAKMWQGFVQKWLTYANDSKWNDVYQKSPDYFSAVLKGRMADCDVANTVFLLGCAHMGIDGELVGGYEVQKLDGAEAKLTPNDLHAISRIYDQETKQLVVFDATPSDPNQKKEKGEEEDNEGGDSGGAERKPVNEEEGEGSALDEQEQDIPGEKEIKKMERDIEDREKAEREAASRKVEAEEFGRDAGCSEKEAQEVLDEIQEAMKTSGEGDSPIVDRLLDQFKRLIQELTISRSTAMPSVQQSMGEDLIDPVEGYVSVKAGAMDPSGFARTREINEKIQHYGGFRLVIVNDRSGSTDSPINIRDKSSRSGWRISSVIKEERKVNYLVLEALSMFQKLAKQQQSTMAPPPLNIETQILGFPGDSYGIPVTEIKPLSKELTNKDRLATHRALSTSGGSTPDGDALRWIREQLSESDLKRLKSKDLLMIVIVNADGGSNDSSQVERELRQLNNLGVIVKGRGLGESVTQIIDTYAPDGSCGSIDSYPEFVAQEIIEAVQRLAPKRVGRVT